MTDWSAGYVSDIQYTSGFYYELSPVFLHFAALTQGIRPPSIGPGATYCELGCGQGIGTLILAAANPQMSFWGFDFNPGQIANARRLAEAGGVGNVSFADYSFEQALALPPGTLPQFDFITLHGIYSWVSPENRRFIVQFIDRHLKPGGLVYVSYNCMPGWTYTGPVQRLIREHANRHPGRSDRQAAAGLAFAATLAEGEAIYFRHNPAAKARLKTLGEHQGAYLAHEYLNGHWHPMYHLDVVAELEPARLSYVGSAVLSDNNDTLSVPKALIPLIRQTDDPGWRETLRDYGRNQGFRRDIFARGASPMTPAEQNQLLGDTAFVLTVPRGLAKLTFSTALGQAHGREAVCNPILDALAERPHTLRELVALPALKDQAGASVVQAVTILVQTSQIHPASPAASSPASSPAASRAGVAAALSLNRAIAARNRFGDGIHYLAAPAIGTGVSAAYAELLGVLALEEAEAPDVGQVARLGWSIMAQTGRRMKRDEVSLVKPDENVAELELRLNAFFADKLPVWKSLGVT